MHHLGRLLRSAAAGLTMAGCAAAGIAPPPEELPSAPDWMTDGAQVCRVSRQEMEAAFARQGRLSRVIKDPQNGQLAVELTRDAGEGQLVSVQVSADYIHNGGRRAQLEAKIEAGGADCPGAYAARAVNRQAAAALATARMENVPTGYFSPPRPPELSKPDIWIMPDFVR